MVQAINKIHSESTILNSNEGTMYKYNGVYWARNDSLKLHKYVDKSISDIDPSGFTTLDYIEISKSYCNILLQSETLKDSLWKKNNVTISTEDNYFKFPDNAKSAYMILTKEAADTPKEYSIDQRFYANLNKTYVFSMFIKNIDSTIFSKAAITIKDKTYNKIMSASFDLKTLNFINNEADISNNIKFYNSNFDEIEDGTNYFSDYSAKIKRISQNGEFYYRPYIIFKIKNNTNFSVGLNLLNELGEYKYQPSDTVRCYISGGQLERFDKTSDAVIGPYMITYRNEARHIVPVGLYRISGGQFAPYQHKLYYLKSVKEKIVNENDMTYKEIDISDPVLTGMSYDDLAIVQSVISFGTVASNILKSYSSWSSNKLYKLNDKVVYLNNLYMCKRTHTSSNSFTNDITNWEIILDGVGLGRIKPPKEIDTLPLNCLIYDEESKTYRIKKHTEEGDRWMMLNSKLSKYHNYAIIHAMTLNQGVFSTWDEETIDDVNYTYGFNSGGNYNFVKLSHISKNL